MTHFAIWSQCRRWQDPSNIKQNPAQALNLQALCPSLDIGWQECKHRFLGGRQAAECAKQSIRRMPEMQTSTVTRRLTGDAWYAVMLPTDLNSCVKFLIRPSKFRELPKLGHEHSIQVKRQIDHRLATHFHPAALSAQIAEVGQTEGRSQAKLLLKWVADVGAT